MTTQIEALYKRHYNHMLLTARTLLGNDEEARDAVSDVFTELLASGHPLRPELAESYLLVSVRNRCMNMLAHRRVVKASEQLLSRDAEATSYDEPPLDQVLDYVDTGLTDKTKHVVKLRFLQKKKYNEIATDMGISRVAVYKHLSQGLRQLRAHFSWYSAVVALLLMLSSVALAFFIRHQYSAPQPQPSATPAVSATAPAPRQPQSVHYEDAPLEQILADVAAYHRVQLRFLSADARRLRLHYDWHQAEPLSSIIATLSLFECISLELQQDTLYVR